MLLLSLIAWISWQLSRDDDACSLPDWPSVPTQWELGGARERCFCAYALFGHGSAMLARLCPSWRDWVSTDGVGVTRLRPHGAAMVIGAQRGNGSMGRYAFVRDWAVDLGSGFDTECDRTRSAECVAIGAHVLSIPRTRYIADCCASPTGLHRLLRSGVGGATALAAALVDVSELCLLLRDLIAGALQLVPDLSSYRSCKLEGEEPTADARCLAQCFHIVPDVNFLHLHTTAGALRIRSDVIDSGLGPSYNASEAHDVRRGLGRYNLCACEPAEWAADGRGRGHCPVAQPSEAPYVLEAAVSLCRNMAGVAGMDASLCDKCADIPS